MVHSNSAEQPYIKDWDQYFLNIARAVAWKSKDPKCQVGAVIVSEDQLVLATGFNGLARGVFDAEDLLQDAKEKLRWICHAETNAIFNAARTGASLKGCTIFVTKFPCLVCCDAIAQAGIKRAKVTPGRRPLIGAFYSHAQIVVHTSAARWCKVDPLAVPVRPRRRGQVEGTTQ